MTSATEVRFKLCLSHGSLEDQLNLKRCDSYHVQRICDKINRYTLNAKELHERAAMWRMSTETFAIVVRNWSVQAPCRAYAVP